MASDVEAARPRGSEGRRKFGIGGAAYLFAVVLAVIGVALLAFGQVPAVLLLFAAGGLAAAGHRNLRSARSNVR